MNKPSLVCCLAALGFLISGAPGSAAEKAEVFSIHYSHAGLREITIKDGRLKYSWVTGRIGGPVFPLGTLDDFDQHQMNVWLTDKEMGQFREWMVRHKVFDFKSGYPKRPGRETYGSAFHSVLTVEQKDKKQGISWTGHSQTPESLQAAVGDLIKTADEVRGDRYRKTIEQSPPRKESRELTRGSQTRASPPKTEIWSGRALNACIDEIRAARKHGGRSPKIPLSQEVLARVNLTRGDDGGWIARLVKDGHLEWPAALQGAASETERKKIEKLLPQAVEQAKKEGEAAAKGVEELKQAIQKARARLDDHADALAPEEFIEAFRYLRSLQQAAKALSLDDFEATHEPFSQCQTVADFVTFLTERNLRIAPATPKDEAGYVALYHSLAAYAASITARREKK
jgi:hypothetical protein